jgi:hypothetical protein
MQRGDAAPILASEPRYDVGMHRIWIAAIMLTLVAGQSTQDAIALVEHLGGTIERAAGASGQPVIRIDLHETAIAGDGKRALQAARPTISFDEPT